LSAIKYPNENSVFFVILTGYEHTRVLYVHKTLKYIPVRPVCRGFFFFKLTLKRRVPYIELIFFEKHMNSTVAPTSINFILIPTFCK